jgi:hypothetical protein
MEPECSQAYSRVPTAGPSPEPEEVNRNPSNLFP